MENKINVAELLKDCPQGMELDCTMFENLEFDHIDKNNEIYPIICRTKSSNGKHIHVFTKYGCYNAFFDYSKCVIFPKGKTTWEGFHRPFKDGDIVAGDVGWIGITTGGKINSFIPTYCVVKPNDEFEAYFVEKETWQFSRLATEKEKQKLFQAIKDNGYKWNAETKTLEKLIEPKFKVGDKIRHKATCKDDIYEISKVYDDSYGLVDFTCKLDMKYQDNYELVHNKFDISTLTPFKSKVLVRDDEGDTWCPAVWGCTGVTDMDMYPYIVIGGNGFEQCIPYEGNEHLLGTTDDCDNFYKTWTES